MPMIRTLLGQGHEPAAVLSVATRHDRHHERLRNIQALSHITEQARAQ